MPEKSVPELIEAWHDAEKALWISDPDRFDDVLAALCAATDAVVWYCDQAGHRDLAGPIADYKEDLLASIDSASSTEYASIVDAIRCLKSSTNRARRKCLGALERLPKRLTVPADEPIKLVPGGYRLSGGVTNQLSGKPAAMLHVLLDQPDQRITADKLSRTLWPNEAITYPEQAVRDTAKKLRRSLRNALRLGGVKPPPDPLPSTGRGADLTYRLDLPPLPKR